MNILNVYWCRIIFNLILWRIRSARGRKPCKCLLTVEWHQRNWKMFLNGQGTTDYLLKSISVIVRLCFVLFNSKTLYLNMICKSRLISCSLKMIVWRNKSGTVIVNCNSFSSINWKIRGGKFVLFVVVLFVFVRRRGMSRGGGWVKNDMFDWMI